MQRGRDPPDSALLDGVPSRVVLGRRRLARAHGIRGTLKTGGVTVIQRFGSALNLNVHFHTLMMDGVYEIGRNGAAVFHPVPAPSDEDVAAVAERVYQTVARKLDTRSDDESAALASAEPVLATLAGASVAGVAATGARRGARTLRLGSGAFEATISSRRCASVEGFSLHANVRVAANDRDGLEHLARYLARPPIATDRLTLLPDGRVALRFKRPFSDGTEAVVFTPSELIERLLPLVPRPRKHIIRFHGILAPAAGYQVQGGSDRFAAAPVNRRRRRRPVPSSVGGPLAPGFPLRCARVPTLRRPHARRRSDYRARRARADSEARRRTPGAAADRRSTRAAERREGGDARSSPPGIRHRRQRFVLTRALGGSRLTPVAFTGPVGPCFRPAGPVGPGKLGAGRVDGR